ncbi:QWRF motif-containing protein 2 [Citrus sinensis]|uniref:QWRF motif-containing protein 2 n=1 Tax=Citrus clementina TaxID=85681 RepID=V4SGQ9_CITCL|nr:QWRF motif-containing protein 2 [Citrus x clementina]XP_006472286.2 QWRF motif-containing protein 2 [Citrus sinensis]ESR46863.1 hypothetical protein CICLE_v10000532mg [Citrus x clementina]KAH9689889.1 QWRF motif-containing protein 2 [Citrus sinensis]
MVVAAVSTAISNTPKTTSTTTQNPSTRTRPPLLPSDPENGLANHRRPKSREVTSRYLSSSVSSSSSSSSTSSTASKRCPSPLVSRRTSSTTATMTPISSAHSTVKRSQSAERGRPVTPRLNSNGHLRTGELSAAQKMLFTSTRSLSVSFQGESFPLQVSKAKPAPSPSPISTSSAVRKGTPERRKAVTSARDHTENSKPERWPGRSRQPNSLSRSVDCTDERRNLVGSGGNVVRALQNSMIDNSNNSNRALFETRLSTDSANAVLDKIQSQKKKQEDDDGGIRCDLTASDTESVSSGSTSEAHERNGVGIVNPRGPRGIVVPARFWHETSNRLRQQADPSTPVSKTNGLKIACTPKLIVPKKFGFDSPASSPKGVVNTRGLSSPLRSAARPASPSKLVTSAGSSPVRGLSPSRVRNTAMGMNSSNLISVSNAPSVMSYAVDVRRGKVGENRVVDAHLLRLFHNRLLQWRFVNARANAALSAQRLNAERSLYNAWIASSRLRESVRTKRTELQLLKQNLKLTSILKSQMTFLEESALMDRDYSSSLLGAIEALRASTLRLPVVGGARADFQNVKDAISSAVDVMQAMASSICLLLSKAGEVNSLVSELSNVSAKEHALLGQCKDLLSTIAAMQVKECSLRTHILQSERLPASLTSKV